MKTCHEDGVWSQRCDDNVIFKPVGLWGAMRNVEICNDE